MESSGCHDVGKGLAAGGGVYNIVGIGIQKKDFTERQSPRP